ncbi:MAG: hypothetical protein HDS73_07130 [Bacteroidales bacterium]|nr:hypothetical protein [Bacteroidales bacterium]
MRKKTRFLLIALGILSLTFPASAVTKEEMEQARTIAAQRYLRYANDMSGYLDEAKSMPKSMSELESGLRNKEKENLKAFKNIAVPKDYESWDKKKLADYWAEAVKNGKELTEKGRTSYNSIRGRIAEMKVSAPAETPKAETKPEQAEQPEQKAEAVAPEQVAGEIVSLADGSEEGIAADTVSEMPEVVPDEEPAQESSSNTWTYVAILGVLVIVVISLMVYASNALKRNNNRNSRRDASRRPSREREQEREKAPARDRDLDTYKPAQERLARAEERPTPPRVIPRDREAQGVASQPAAENRAAMRQEREISERDAKIQQLEADLRMSRGELRHATTQLEEARQLISQLQAENSALRQAAAAEAPAQPRVRQSFHRTPVAEAHKEVQSEAAPMQAEVVAPARPEAPVSQEATAPRKREEAPAEDEQNRKYMPGNHTASARRTIFLGKVNSKGMFVRADRNFNPGNSFYRLVTADGATGTFTLVNDPSVVEVALVNKDDVLFNACNGPELDDTYGLSEIRTEMPGKAVFEDGAWRVVRKAVISYL